MAHPIVLAALLFATEFFAPALPRVEYPAAAVREGLRQRLDAKLTLTMEIAANGLISQVEVLSHENLPAEELASAVAFFKAQLEGKRALRPAEQDGKPVACTYRHIFVWTVAYPPPTEYRYPDDLPRDGQYFEDLPDLPRARIRLDVAPPVPLVETPDGRAVPVERFREELDAKARSLMDPASLREIREGPLGLLTDETDAATLDFCLATLKAVPVEFVRVFAPVLPQAPSIPSYRAYLFRRPQDLMEFQKAMGVPRWADGAYLGTLRVLSASTGHGHPYRVREVLVHEQVHALVRELLLPRTAAPMWLNEGLAEVFAGSRIDEKGRMAFGTVDRKEALDRRSGKVWTARSRLHLLYLWDRQSALKGRLAAGLVYDRWSPGEDLSEGELQRFYAASWGLTRALLGEGPALPAPAFLDYLRDLQGGVTARAAFAARFGSFEEAESKLWKALRKW